MSRCTRAYQTWGPALFIPALFPQSSVATRGLLRIRAKDGAQEPSLLPLLTPPNTNKASRYLETYAGRRRPKSSPAIPSWDAWGHTQKKLTSHTTEHRVSAYKSSLLVPRSVIPLLARWCQYLHASPAAPGCVRLEDTSKRTGGRSGAHNQMETGLSGYSRLLPGTGGLASWAGPPWAGSHRSGLRRLGRDTRDSSQTEHRTQAGTSIR